MTQTFSTSELARISGFSIRQIEYWIKQGLIIPSIQKSSGKGNHHKYSVEDLIQIQVIRRLKVFGWSTQKIRKAIDTLRQVIDNPDPLKNVVLISGKNTLVAFCKTREGERILLDALNGGGQQMMRIVLEHLIDECDQKTYFEFALQGDNIK